MALPSVMASSNLGTKMFPTAYSPAAGSLLIPASADTFLMKASGMATSIPAPSPVFSSQPQAKVPRHATSKHSRPRPQFRKMKTAHTQQLFRSEEPGVAEYGLEGDNILNEEVLPSEVGTGGPVIGVDGVPSNGEHDWIHYDEPLDFACDPSILGCEDGLEVENYAEN